MREGVPIAILGAPNAGKSSLFNVLAARDAAIVSDTAGTTRDVLEIALNLGGVKCRLQDTAGLRRATEADAIEREGMKRAMAAAANAHLIVALVDALDCEVGLRVLENLLDQDTTSSDNDSYDPKRVMLILNKVDLLQDVNGAVEDSIQGVDSPLFTSISERVGATFQISCRTQTGIDAFLEDLTRRVVERVEGTSNDDGSNEGALITRARHRFDALSLQGIMAADMAAEELRLAASELGRITGAVDVEDVLDKLFSDFCIGK